MRNEQSFLPAFGNKPKYIIGRGGVTSEFVNSLALPVGHRNRATILIGQRGTGKTTLLLNFEEIAEQADIVCARVAASDEMLDEIIQAIQLNGAKYVPSSKAKVKGISVGVLGFSFGLTFSEEAKTQLGFRMKLSLLCDELEKHDKGVLILVDEVQTSTAAMRTLATTYQHLVGEGKNISVVMAGLPSSISTVLNDDILTFLNRANKVFLEPLPYGEISAAYANEFARQGKTVAPEVLKEVAKATRGYPYLFQLVGYYILKYSQSSNAITEETVKLATHTSREEMVSSIFNAALAPLSQRDKDFLKAMSKDIEFSRVSDIRQRMKVSQAYVQMYRSRLIEAGVVSPAGRGLIAITIPYLGEYLRGDF
ncbi:MAG: ATP-binding protein [Coriobacteriia bacterium]|nr:ATP-binding protein [Coriobacteriia bacterium]